MSGSRPYLEQIKERKNCVEHSRLKKKHEGDFCSLRGIQSERRCQYRKKETSLQ